MNLSDITGPGGCGCGSNPSVAITPCTNDKCRKSLSSTKIAELVWLMGLDENLCERFQRVADVFQLKDCAGNTIALDTPLVTCTAFKDRLCAILAGLVPNGQATAGTLLVGADCKLYTVPTNGEVTETPNTAVDSSTVDVSATGTLGRAIGAAVKISTDPDNVLTVDGTGLFVPTPPGSLTACQQIQNFDTGDDAIEGTVLIGADCEKHILRWPDPISVSDTSSIDMTLAGDNISASLRIDPQFIGRVTADGLELTCADVLNCAPPVTVVDTNTVDHTLVGQQLSSAVRISASPGNNTTALGDGIYTNVCQAIAAFPGPIPAVPGDTELVGADCNLYTLPESTEWSIADTTTVDLDLDGGPTLRATVLIQPNTLITVGQQGIQVLCEAVQDCVFGTNNNFWTYNDAGDQVLFNPSADVGNQITTGVDGRPFVPPLDLVIDDVDECITLTLIDNTLSAAIEISANPDNAISCQGDGLYVADTTATVTGVDTDCLATQVTEVTPNVFEVTVTPILDGGQPNALTCGVNGLHVPQPTVFVGSAAGSGALHSGPLSGGQIVVGGPSLINVTNTDTINSALVILSITKPSVLVRGAPANDWSLLLEVELDINFPAVIVTGPFNDNEDLITGLAGQQGGSPRVTTVYQYIVPPSFAGSFTYTVTLTNEVAGAPGDLADVTVSAIEARYSIQS